MSRQASLVTGLEVPNGGPEVYPDRPLTVGSCRWKCLTDYICGCALPMCSLSWTLWDITAEHLIN